MPGECLDAPEDLPKEAPRQLAFDQLEDEVSGISDEAAREPYVRPRLWKRGEILGANGRIFGIDISLVPP